MGSKSSSMRRPSESWFDRARRKLVSSLFCGASTSQSPSEMEGYNLAKSSVTSLEDLTPVSDVSRSFTAESSSIFGTKSPFTSSETEAGTSSGSSSDSSEATRPSKDLLGSKESASSDGNRSIAGSPLDTDSDAFANRTLSRIGPEEIHSSNVAQENLNGGSEESHDNAVNGHDIFAPESITVLPDSFLLGTHTAHLARAAASGFPLPGSERDSSTRGLLHVDMVSISSNILSSSIGEISNRETRRNSRRQFWDALSRRSFRGHNDSSTIVFTTGHADDLGSHDRWLFDLNGDLHYDGRPRDLIYLGGRGHRRSERRRQVRSEILEGIRNGLDEEGQQTTFCASGLHPNGTCLCDSFATAEESSTSASISWIVMLVEALFEVLDEIHRQPLSLSIASLPAPESVVDSFPLKNHKKLGTSGGELNNGEQCHICLAEYEEGDKIRVLPCRHEYHMSCVDKWLKEVQCVCPLCRSNVCEDVAQASTSNPEIPIR